MLGTRLHERVALYAGVVLQPPPAMGETIKFEPSPDNGDFIGGSSYQLLPLVGARLDFGPSFPMYLRAALTFPLSVQGGTVHEDDPVAPDYFPVGADVALGVRL